MWSLISPVSNEHAYSFESFYYDAFVSKYVSPEISSLMLV